jgi:predicted Rossmann fold flavoprotein
MRADIDAVVVGGGAAGLMCAAAAGKRGRRVVVLERADKLGKKILISGGGRCNFTNIYTAPDRYISQNPHFCRSALSRYTPSDFIALVEKHGIRYHEKTLGQLFCDGSAREIVRALESECSQSGNVDIRLSCEIGEISRADDGRFLVDSSVGDFRARAVVVATGGLSIPKMGATDFGLRIARRFGLRIVPTRPALVPLTTHSERFGALSGVSLEASVSCGAASFREALLFTHRGLSGPAVLQISSYWERGKEIVVNAAPDFNPEAFWADSRRRSTSLKNALLQSASLPKRFVEAFCEEYAPDIAAAPTANLARRRYDEFIARLQSWSIIPDGDEGYAKAEVTAGGVDTNDLSSKTMESLSTPGLYFIGEVVDVTGWLGGYNFQWAWASGVAAGSAL